MSLLLRAGHRQSSAPRIRSEFALRILCLGWIHPSSIFLLMFLSAVVVVLFRFDSLLRRLSRAHASDRERRHMHEAPGELIRTRPSLSALTIPIGLEIEFCVDVAHSNAITRLTMRWKLKQ
jgi:hypothetical protein